MAKAKQKEKAATRERDRDRDRDRPERPKAQNDAYVMMLVITFFAILAGCVLLYLDNQEYGGKSPTKAVIPAMTELGKGASAEPAPK